MFTVVTMSLWVTTADEFVFFAVPEGRATTTVTLLYAGTASFAGALLSSKLAQFELSLTPKRGVPPTPRSAVLIEASNLVESALAWISGCAVVRLISRFFPILDASPSGPLGTAARLLGVSLEGMIFALTHRTIKIGIETKIIPFTASQAADARDALAKAVYSRMFDDLVKAINMAIGGGEKDCGKHRWLRRIGIVGRCPGSCCRNEGRPRRRQGRRRGRGRLG